MSFKKRHDTQLYHIVLAGCIAGKYGKNCNISCSPNCKKSTKCSLITGKCTDGCKKGWTGKKCNKGNFTYM